MIPISPQKSSEQAKEKAPTVAQNSTTLYESGAFVCLHLRHTFFQLFD